MAPRVRATNLASLILFCSLTACENTPTVDPTHDAGSLGGLHNQVLDELGAPTDDSDRIAAAVARSLGVEADELVFEQVELGRRIAADLIFHRAQEGDAGGLSALLDRYGASEELAGRIESWAQNLLDTQALPTEHDSQFDGVFLEVAAASQSYWAAKHLPGSNEALKFSTRNWIVVGDAIGGLAGFLGGGPAGSVAVGAATSSFVAASLLKALNELGDIGALHNAILDRAGGVQHEYDPAHVVEASWSVYREGGFPPSADGLTRADFESEERRGRALAVQIRKLLEQGATVQQWTDYLSSKGVPLTQSGPIAAEIVKVQRVRGKLSFEEPARGHAHFVFRDLLLHSDRYWRDYAQELGEKHESRKIVIADAAGGLVGLIWGPAASILLGATTSLAVSCG